MSHKTELDRETLATILECSQDSVFVTDGDGVVIFVNPVAAELLGFSVDELEGKSIHQLLQGKYYRNSAVLKALKSGKVETEMVLYQTGLVGVSTSVPVLAEDGSICLVITNTSGEERIKMLQSTIEQDQRVLKRYQREVEHLRRNRRLHVVAESEPMKDALRAASLVAHVDMPIMLIGETGVGKDVLANYIHRESERHDQAFVDINCAAIPDNMLEAELFGYERGAFTGANSGGKMGLFELANGGTLFLDEIAELPISLQAKLLKVLESGTFRRIGGTANICSDVRIICATNRNVEEMIQNKTFRADLFYRLNGLRIDLPPLRDRKEDILPLAEFFLSLQNEKYGQKKRLSERMKKAMESYCWPGNVRELRNVIGRAYFLAVDDELNSEFDDYDSSVSRESGVKQAKQQEFCGTLREYRNRAEMEYIEYVLAKHNRKVEAAAGELGITRSQLYRILKREQNDL